MTCRLVARRDLHALATSDKAMNFTFKTSQNHFIYTRLLSSCKHLKTLLQIHAHLIVSGFKEDSSLNNHLIRSYSSFQKCEFARFVFNSIPNPDVVLYNSMIRAYTRTNEHKEALKLYHLMIEHELEPDKYTFTFVLKACTGAFDLEEGVLVHKLIVDRKLECDQFIGTGLVDMYGKLGGLDLARQVFDQMPKRDVVAWNSMIGCFAQSCGPQEALRLFRIMRLSGAEPDIVSFLNLVPAVSKLAEVDCCSCVHGYVIRMGYDEVLSNGLIDMYCKCGDVHAARVVFDGMWVKNDVSWGTMMAGYAHNNCFPQVLELFDQIKNDNVGMHKVAVGSALLAAGEVRDLDKGEEIRDWVMRQDTDMDIQLATSVMNMYAKCGELEQAKKLFWKLQERDVVAWSAIIASFVQSGYLEEALSLFRDMQTSCVRPNNITLMSIIPACAQLSLMGLGKSVHCYALKTIIDSDISTATALVSMYARCGLFSMAHTVFSKMQNEDVIAWNALINGYIRNGFPYNAVEIILKLQSSDLYPDSGTIVNFLQACVLLNDLDLGAYIHGRIMKCGYQFDCHVMNALVDMYVKCGNLPSAETLFNSNDFAKDQVSWNVIISGYMHNGRAKDSISAFQHMRLENFQPSVVTIVSVLPAITHLSALAEGMAIHAMIIQMGFLSNTLVGNSLIDMYSKCGRLKDAEKHFNEMEDKDTSSWNTMLAGYAVHGQGDRAIALFSLMQNRNIETDSVSFVNILSACRHSGLVEEGKSIFSSMQEIHCVTPNSEHFACMVDLLGRAGLFDEAIEFIKKMPMKPDAGIWGALLSASREHCNVRFGEIAMNHLVKLEPENPTNYVVLRSIYAQSARWNDADNTKSQMKKRGLVRTPGFSWV